MVLNSKIFFHLHCLLKEIFFMNVLSELCIVKLLIKYIIDFKCILLFFNFNL